MYRWLDQSLEKCVSYNLFLFGVLLFCLVVFPALLFSVADMPEDMKDLVCVCVCVLLSQFPSDLLIVYAIGIQ